MAQDQFLGIFRAVLACIGGLLIAHSHLVTASDWELIAGAATSIAPAVWSWYQKKQAARALLLARAAPSDPNAVIALVAQAASEVPPDRSPGA
jgi:hypothetical protein